MNIRSVGEDKRPKAQKSRSKVESGHEDDEFLSMVEPTPKFHQLSHRGSGLRCKRTFHCLQ